MSEINQKLPYQYRRGRRARINEKPITECPYGDKTSKSLWKSGWHDTDMEMGGAK